MILIEVPHALSAANPEELKRKMIKVQFKTGKKFRFHSIQFAQGKWWAFYDLELEEFKNFPSEVGKDGNTPG